MDSSNNALASYTIFAVAIVLGHPERSVAMDSGNNTRIKRAIFPKVSFNAGSHSQSQAAVLDFRPVAASIAVIGGFDRVSVAPSFRKLIVE